MKWETEDAFPLPSGRIVTAQADTLVGPKADFATATCDVGRCPFRVNRYRGVRPQGRPMSAVALPAQPVDATPA